VKPIQSGTSQKQAGYSLSRQALIGPLSCSSFLNRYTYEMLFANASGACGTARRSSGLASTSHSWTDPAAALWHTEWTLQLPDKPAVLQIGSSPISPTVCNIHRCCAEPVALCLGTIGRLFPGTGHRSTGNRSEGWHSLRQSGLFTCTTECFVYSIAAEVVITSQVKLKLDSN
jgi:hypothetical protein